MSTPIRISASRLKTFKECQLTFWYQDVERLPSATHWKTKVGTVVHLLFECCLHPRRAALLREALKDDTWRASQRRELERFICWQLRRHDITLSSVDEVSELLRVAFIAIKPHFDTLFAALDAGQPAPFTYHTEKRFQMQVGQATISGFIDLLLVWPDRALVIDLKTQARKWTVADVPNNVQAALYALATYRELGLLAATDFVMVRHAPSKRYPLMHLQSVAAPSKAHLAGLEAYVETMYGVVNQLTLDQARQHPHASSSFCEKVCGYHKPFDYWAVVKRADPTVALKTYLFDRAPTEVAEDEQVVLKRHEGCIHWRG